MRVSCSEPVSANPKRKRADERTRTAYPCSLPGIRQALQEIALGRNSRISKLFALHWLAQCCTVLRSRWCQSGVGRLWVTRRRVLCSRWVSRKGDGLPATALVHARPGLARVLVSRCRARPRPPPQGPRACLPPRRTSRTSLPMFGSSASYPDPNRRSCLRRGTPPGPLLTWWRFFPRGRRCCAPPPLGPFLPRWWLLPRWRLPARRGSDVGRHVLLRRNHRSVGYGSPFHIPRRVPQRGTRDIRRAATGGGGTRSWAGAELRRVLENTEQPFRPLCDLRLHDLRFPEESCKPLVANRLGVEGVTFTGVGAAESVVEDAYEVVVLVPGARGLLTVIHHELLP